jgi:hypothetical protein
LARSQRPRPGKELRRLKGRFQAGARRQERALKLRRAYRRAKIPVLAASVALVLYVVLIHLSPWPPMVTLKHIVSSRNCDAAREMGLAPAYRGDPGYWPSHDRDGDGIACEAWPPHRR